MAVRVRRELVSDASLTMRSLGHSRWILVASPQVASRLGADIASLNAFPTLGTSDDQGEVEWRFEQTGGAVFRLRYEPRLTCSDFAVLCDAAAEGIGIAYLPGHVCAGHIADGKLVHVLRDWQGQAGIVHLVFTTRRGLPPVVRALIDHLAAAFPKL